MTAAEFVCRSPAREIALCAWIAATQQYLRDSMKPDIQICNHNYLLADASHRLEDRPLLLRSYQALVVDEAHKLPDAARQMYTETLSPAQHG